MRKAPSLLDLVHGEGRVGTRQTGEEFEGFRCCYHLLKRAKKVRRPLWSIVLCDLHGEDHRESDDSEQVHKHDHRLEYVTLQSTAAIHRSTLSSDCTAFYEPLLGGT